MCRACSKGGRRCPSTESSRQNGRAAANRYYQRGKARRKIAELADVGIPAVGDDDMPTTYHQHTPDKPVTLDPGKGAANPDRALPDKPSGALWTSPGRIDADGNVKTAWTDWAAREDYGEGGQLVEMNPQPGAVVVTITNGNDARALMGRYGIDDADGRKSFDWAAMREGGIDGVHVTERMASVHSFAPRDDDSTLAHLEGWSAGSTAWLSSEHLEVGESREPGTYTYIDPEDDDPGWYREVKPEEGEGTYDEPSRLNIGTAWDRVPNRFKKDRTPTGDSESPEPGEERSTAYQYGQGQQGVKVPEEMSVMDLGATLLAGASPRRKGKGKTRAGKR